MTGAPARGGTTEMSTGKIIGLSVCAMIAFFHVAVGAAALSWRGAENYEGLWFMIVGIPLFVLEIILSIVLLVGLYPAGRGRAFATQIPLAISVLMVVTVATRLGWT